MNSSLPSSDTPLYNHPLYTIEKWLKNLGCQQNKDKLNCWFIQKLTWKAEICLDIDKITVCYFNAGADNSDINRSFKYSLSRQDIEDAVFTGP